MKNILSLLCLLLALAAQPVVAQNLVPNPSFEELSYCPNNLDQLNSAIGWFKTSLYVTPDNLNECAINTSAYIPINDNGYQTPRTGKGFAAIVTRDVSDGIGDEFNPPYWFREYLQIKLKSPLVRNKKYYVKFYVSLADKLSGFAIYSIGAYFSNSKIEKPDTFTFNLEFTPQIENPKGNFLIDTFNWMPISGSFIANGDEEYLIIGNFKSFYETESLKVVNDSNPIYESYYYVDDVCVSINECDTLTNLNDINSETMFTYNFENNFYNIQSIRTGSYYISDLNANILISNPFTEGKTEIDCSFLPSGMYLITIKTQNTFVIKKLLINH